MKKKEKAITIGGSDPSGGAGIQLDIKVFERIGVYGLSVITSVTVQNSRGVFGIYPIPPDIVWNEIKFLFEDFKVKFGKVGVLYLSETIKKVAEAVDKFGLYLVVDPIFKSKNGFKLIEKEEDIKILIKKSFIITPNIDEAEVITGMKIRGIEDMKRCAEKIKNMGAQNVLIKGGHIKSPDVFFDGEKFYIFKKKMSRRVVHGTGCLLSSSICAYLSKGLTLQKAIKMAEKFTEKSISKSQKLGKGFFIII